MGCMMLELWVMWEKEMANKGLSKKGNVPGRKEGRREAGKEGSKKGRKEGRKEDTLSANSSIWHSKFLEASKEGRRAVGQLLPAATATASAGEGAAPFFYTLED